jgi:hypothetical protein
MLSTQEFAAKIKQKYPQYQNVDDNTLTQKITEKYPQYKNQINSGDYWGKGAVDLASGVGREVAGGAASAAGGLYEGAGGIVQGAGQLLDAVNPVNVFSRVTGVGKPVEVAQAVTKPIYNAGKQLNTNIQGQADASFGAANPITKAVGGITGNVAAEIPGLVFGGAALSGLSKGIQASSAASKLPAVIKTAVEAAGPTANFIAKSVGSTGLATGATEGKLPDAGEVGTGLALDTLLAGISKAGGKFYNKAFSNTKNADKAFIGNYGQSLGEQAGELGYKGSATQIKNQAEAAQKVIWNQMDDLAKSGKPITKKEFLSIATDLKGQYENLPETAFKKSLFNQIDDTVAKFAPTKSMSGTQAIEQIKYINNELFGEGSKVVLTPKQAASMANQVKSAVKDKLPEGMRGLYKKYAINEAIENVMRDKEVQKIVMRQSLGASTGGLAGFGMDPTADIGKKIGSAVAGAILGGLLGTASGSIALRTTLGAVAKSASTPLKSTIVKTLANKIKASFLGSSAQQNGQ